jgi:hypothetical protein
MGYSAYVICDCYQKGKTIDPPHKEYFRFDDEGMYLEIPDEIWDQDEETAFSLQKEFSQWLSNSCEHDDMEIAHERLYNACGSGSFYSFIGEEGGKKKFPVLTKYLPRLNGGILPASKAAAALHELEVLESNFTVNERVVLIETKSGVTLASTMSDKPFLVMAASMHCLFIDGDGFSVVPAEYWYDIKREVLMSSSRFIQHSIGIGQYRYTDINTGKSIVCTHNIYPMRGLEPIIDYEFSVVKEPYYEWEHSVIKALEKLAQASLKTGNPIHWC